MFCNNNHESIEYNDKILDYCPLCVVVATLAKQEAELEKLKDSLAVAEDEISDLRSKVDDLEEERDDALEKASSWESDVEFSSKTIADLEDKVRGLEIVIEDANSIEFCR